MKTRSTRLLLVSVAIVLSAAISLGLGIRIGAAQFGDRSFLTDVATGDEQGLVVIAPDARKS
jgi:hypothetical protein